MATVNEACTPYFIHFSIRRKFSKISRNSLLQTKNSQDDSLHRELLQMQSEYEKLYNFCQFETKQKAALEAELQKEVKVKNELQDELSKVYIQLNLTVRDENQAHKLVKDDLNIKSVEIKQLKNQVEELKKDKNSLSVALKGKKQEIKEIYKANAKQKEALEKKVIDLNEYKTRKMTEEREERIKKKKELKKEKQKNRRLVKHDTDDASNIPNVELTEVKESKIKTNSLVNEQNPKETDDSRKAVEENEAPEKELEDVDVNLMSDNDFAEHLWMTFCGRPRPAEYCSQQESVPEKHGDDRELDDR